MMNNDMDAITQFALKKARLTELQAIALSKYLNGLTHREIAEDMGCSRQMISKRLKTALQKIRTISPLLGVHRGNLLKISTDRQ